VSELSFDIAFTIAMILMLLGAFFSLSAVIGLVRFPDFLTKIHAVSVSDSLGVPLILLGLMVLSGFNLITLKLFILIILIFITGPMVVMELGNYYVTKQTDGADDDADE